MSNIYIQEPPTNGKVLLNTTVGDIDIELWSKETPKACRNFVQLCLEGYYDGTIFHRVVKGFIVQGGDPTGTGTGGESIYGQPFKDEFHSRLRFVRRGLVAMANSGKDDNESQFFFTLAPTPELQNKHTIFGKVLSNPFPDIVPRAKVKEEKPVSEKPKEKIKKNFKLLSFGEEAEEDEAEVDAVNEAYKGQSKSSHDLANDPKLSSIPAVDVDRGEANTEVLDNIRKKFEKERDSKKEESAKKLVLPEKVEEKQEEDDEEERKRKDIQKQIKELKKELRDSKKVADVIQKETEKESEDSNEEEEKANDVLSGYHKNFELYKNKSKSIAKKGTSEREAQTLALFERFRQKLHKAKYSDDEDERQTADEEEDDSWLKHCFRTEDEKVVLAKDANMPSIDRYDLSDPRNPIVERRRKEKKHRK